MNAGDIVLLGVASLWATAALLGKRRPADLIAVIRADLRRDPGDGPLLSIEADVLAQDLAWMPEAQEPRFAKVLTTNAKITSASSAPPPQ